MNDSRKIEAPRLVIAIGQEANEAGLLLCKYSDASFLFFDEKDLEYCGQTAWVIVTLSRNWTGKTYNFISQFMRNKQFRQVPGIIMAQDSNGLIKIIEKHIRSPLKSLEYPTVLDFHIEQTQAFWLRSPNILNVGPSVSSTDLTKILSAGPDLIRISTHGDGIDADLGSAGVLCGLKPNISFSNSNRRMRCLVNGVCHRIKTPLTETFNSERLFNPNHFQAKIVILDVCWAMKLGDSTYDVETGLFANMLTREEPVTIIAHVGVAFSFFGCDDDLVEDLVAGKTVSDAVYRHNNSQSAKRLGRRYLIFGNPDIRLTCMHTGNTRRGRSASASGNKRLVNNIRTIAKPRTTPDIFRYSELRWLVSCLKVAAETLIRKHGNALKSSGELNETLSQISDLDRDTKNDSDTEIILLKNAVNLAIDIFPRIGASHFIDLWETGSYMNCISVGRCLYCNTEMREYMAHTNLGKTRKLKICESCGIVHDAPHKAKEKPLDIINGNQIKSISTRLTDQTQVSIYLYDGELSRALPLDKNTQRFIIPEALPEGPFLVARWHYNLLGLHACYRGAYKLHGCIYTSGGVQGRLPAGQGARSVVFHGS